MNRIGIAGLPFPERQFRFCPTRRWRADFAYVAERILIEVDGGAYVGGRHTRGQGFEADCEKTSTAAALGFRVIRLTGRMVKSGLAVELIRQALEHAELEEEAVMLPPHRVVHNTGRVVRTGVRPDIVIEDPSDES